MPARRAAIMDSRILRFGALASYVGKKRKKNSKIHVIVEMPG